MHFILKLCNLQLKFKVRRDEFELRYSENDFAPSTSILLSVIIRIYSFHIKVIQLTT
jgi:hypothetical protein